MTESLFFGFVLGLCAAWLISGMSRTHKHHSQDPRVDECIYNVQKLIDSTNNNFKTIAQVLEFHNQQLFSLHKEKPHGEQPKQGAYAAPHHDVSVLWGKSHGGDGGQA